MEKYTHINQAERAKIYEGLCQGLGPTAIGARIGRCKSSISRELRRNGDSIGYLRPSQAHNQALERRARHGLKIDRYPEMRQFVIAALQSGDSPYCASVRWNTGHPETTISTESIYGYIYHPDNQGLGLWKQLRKAKKVRGLGRPRKTKSKIPNRVSIHERPPEIATRQELGDYEADLIFHEGSASANVLTVVDRCSRQVFLVKHDSKHSAPIVQSIIDHLEPALTRSVTFDNGAEFTNHFMLNALGIQTYFCDPASPWQKGSCENFNGLVREELPFDTKPHTITQENLDQIAHIYNNKPRKSLGGLSPNQLAQSIRSRVKPALPAVEALLISFDNQDLKAVALRS